MTSHLRPTPSRLLVTVVLPALALASLGGCKASDEKVTAMAAQAQALLEAGRPAEAQQLIAQALKKRDDIPAVYLVAAHIALASGKRGEAYQDYTSVLALQSTNNEALLGTAQTGLGSGHIDEADKAADKVLVLNPSQPDALLVKGIIRMVRNDLDSALAFSDRVLAAQPGNVAGAILKSRVLALSGDRAGALALIEQTIKRDGDSLELTMAAAELQRGGGDPNAFLAELRRIREQLPRDRNYRVDLIDTLYRLGRIDEARAEASSLLDEPITASDELARFPRLWAAYDPPALTDAQIAHAAKDASVEVRMMLARYFISTGRPAVAAAVLRPVATGWSSDVQALYARVAEAGGQSAAARASADQILAKDPDNGDALLIRAHAAMERGDNKSAIIDLQQVVRDYPQWGEGYGALAHAFLAEKKPLQARRVLEDGRRALPQDLPFARAATQALFDMGEGTAALAVARRFALDSPSLPAGWALYGQACGKADDGQCKPEAAAGAAQARTRFGLDPNPGTPAPVALIGRLR